MSEEHEEEPGPTENRGKIRAKIKKSKQRQQTTDLALSELLSASSGRLWLYDVLQLCHIFGISFSTNALDMARAEGERIIGLDIVNQISRVCPERFAQMMKEGNEEDERS